jgi:hypothetical protein
VLNLQEIETSDDGDRQIQLTASQAEVSACTKHDEWFLKRTRRDATIGDANLIIRDRRMTENAKEDADVLHTGKDSLYILIISCRLVPTIRFRTNPSPLHDLQATEQRRRRTL